MLEVQKPAGLLECLVIDQRDMPEEVGPEPDRQSDERVSDEPDYR